MRLHFWHQSELFVNFHYDGDNNLLNNILLEVWGKELGKRDAPLLCLCLNFFGRAKPEAELQSRWTLAPVTA